MRAPRLPACTPAPMQDREVITAEGMRVVGRGERHLGTLRELNTAAQSDVEVLLLGPSGVGKDLYARLIHDQSARSARAFVPVNCGGLPVALLENELFGHVGGAFTGARPSSQGLVAEADGGTLFLDEIDTLEPAGQVKLLRFLQQHEYRRLGESRLRKADVRIVAASNANLARLVHEGHFREDLFFRIHVFPVRIAPLCERQEDIEPLLAEFIPRCARLFGVSPVRLTAAALQRLEAYPWPGNVRELENCVRYLTSLRLERPVESEDLKLFYELVPVAGSPPWTTGPGESACSRPLRDAKRNIVGEFERKYIVDALRLSHGNIAQAARVSCKPRRAFFGLMRKYGITAESFRTDPSEPRTS
jgi:DNA-binding NtrC family response regulator